MEPSSNMFCSCGWLVFLFLKFFSHSGCRGLLPSLCIFHFYSFIFPLGDFTILLSFQTVEAKIKQPSNIPNCSFFWNGGLRPNWPICWLFSLSRGTIYSSMAFLSLMRNHLKLYRLAFFVIFLLVTFNLVNCGCSHLPSTRKFSWAPNFHAS